MFRNIAGMILKKRWLEKHLPEIPIGSNEQLVLILGIAFVLSGINLVNLNIGIEAMNAALLPIVLGFLYLLAIKSLPDKLRLKGLYAWVVFIILGVTSVFGVYGAISDVISTVK